MFNTEKVANDLILWIRNWFENNGKGCNAVIGVSGGKDSSVVAALCAEALGKDRVIGVMMPNGEQADINDSIRLTEHLGIKSYTVNIKEAYDGVINGMKAAGAEPSRQCLVNLAPRIRMSTLYAVSQSNNGRVANTCNMSEDYVGYSTKYGDMAGDFSPLSRLTVDEVIKIGLYLDLPRDLVIKAPSDGLTGRTDEDNLGFKYSELDKYIRTGICENEDSKAKIDRLHKMNLFKLMPMDAFEPSKEDI